MSGKILIAFVWGTVLLGLLGDKFLFNCDSLKCAASLPASLKAILPEEPVHPYESRSVETR